MGQYYLIANLSKNEFLEPHNFGDGAKLLEFGNSMGGAMTGLSILLASGNGRGGGDLHVEDSIIGSWAGDKIAIVGDYADTNILGIEANKEPLIQKFKNFHGKTERFELKPEHQNIYSLIGYDQSLPKKNQKWKNISKPVIKAMEKDSDLKKNLEKRMEWLKN